MYIIGGHGNSRVVRLNVNDNGKVARLLPDGPSLPYEELRAASVVEDASFTILTLTGGTNIPKAGRSTEERRVWILDTKQSMPAWTEGPGLNTARNNHFAFRLGDHLFVGTGENSAIHGPDNPISSMEMLTPSDTQPYWKTVIDYPIKVNIAPSTLVLWQIYIFINSKIYIFQFLGILNTLFFKLF